MCKTTGLYNTQEQNKSTLSETIHIQLTQQKLKVGQKTEGKRTTERLEHKGSSVYG